MPEARGFRFSLDGGQVDPDHLRHRFYRDWSRCRLGEVGWIVAPPSIIQVLAKQRPVSAWALPQFIAEGVWRHVEQVRGPMSRRRTRQGDARAGSVLRLASDPAPIRVVPAGRPDGAFYAASSASTATTDTKACGDRYCRPRGRGPSPRARAFGRGRRFVGFPLPRLFPAPPRPRRGSGRAAGGIHFLPLEPIGFSNPDPGSRPP